MDDAAPEHPSGAPSPEGWAEAAEARVLDAAIRLTPPLDWSQRLVDRAAAEAGLSAADASLLMPGGPRDLAALYSHRHDAEALVRLSNVDPATLKIRERIRQGVEARVAVAAEEEQAVRRCLAFLALPSNAKLGLALLWDSADAIWRWAGDTATDENHYTKRLILSGVLASTVAVRFAQGPGAASEHLANQIERVMAFEKWKAGLPKPSVLMAQAAAALARRRYG